MKPILFNTDMVQAIVDRRKTTTRRIANINTEIICNDETTNHEFELDNFGDTSQKPTGFVCRKCGFGVAFPHSRVPCGTSVFRPRYWPGDILYVRETWCHGKVAYGEEPDGRNVPFISQCPGEDDIIHKEWAIREDIGMEDVVWHPSIHMPKEAARLFLRVSVVRLERLQEITDDDAIREGIVRMFDHLSDAEYSEWGNKTAKGMAKADWPWNNYLWHGDFGKYGLGNRKSDAWPYQRSGYDSPRDSFSSLWNLTVDLKDWDTYGWDANPWVWVIEFEMIEKEGLCQ